MKAQTHLFQTRDELAHEASSEFYTTPAYLVNQLLDTAPTLPMRLEAEDMAAFTPGELDWWAMNAHSGLMPTVDGLPGTLWVDAGCGTGAIARVIVDHRDVRVIGVEHRLAAVEEARAHLKGRCATIVHDNWLDPHVCNDGRISGADVVVMNSPFGLTHEFVQAAFDHCPNAWVWSLQRQSWVCPRRSIKNHKRVPGRLCWLPRHFPEFILQCVGQRASFSGSGGTDTSEYMWCGWSPTGRNRTSARHLGLCNGGAR